jgi:L-threonylcarbamoyladenylate synthase
MSVFDLIQAIAALELPDGVIGFPTDTVYGIGCYLNQEKAVAKIHRLNQPEFQEIPSGFPLVLMGRSREDLMSYVECPSIQAMATADALMRDYWPGALTLVLPKNSRIPATICPGQETIAIRYPNAPLLLDVLELIPEGVLATTCGGLYQGKGIQTAGEMRRYYGNQLDALLVDDFCLEDKIPSTVVAIESNGQIQILRSGRIVLN